MLSNIDSPWYQALTVHVIKHWQHVVSNISSTCWQHMPLDIDSTWYWTLPVHIDSTCHQILLVNIASTQWHVTDYWQHMFSNIDSTCYQTLTTHIIKRWLHIFILSDTGDSTCYRTLTARWMCVKRPQECLSHRDACVWVGATRDQILPLPDYQQFADQPHQHIKTLHQQTRSSRYIRPAITDT